jgi:peroxiredoxin
MRNNPLDVGQRIPCLLLETDDGQSLDLRAEARKQPLVLIFYRGGWCPYCNLQLGQLQAVDSKLSELGYRIIAISPDLPEKLAESRSKHDLSYTLVSDSSMAASRSFGIAFTVDDETLAAYAAHGIDLEEASGETHHMLPIPSVFIVGTDEIIHFVYSNPDYKVRIDPEELLAAAKDAVEHNEKQRKG